MTSLVFIVLPNSIRGSQPEPEFQRLSTVTEYGCEPAQQGHSATTSPSSPRSPITWRSVARVCPAAECPPLWWSPITQPLEHAGHADNSEPVPTILGLVVRLLSDEDQIGRDAARTPNSHTPDSPKPLHPPDIGSATSNTPNAAASHPPPTPSALSPDQTLVVADVPARQSPPVPLPALSLIHI